MYFGKNLLRGDFFSLGVEFLCEYKEFVKSKILSGRSEFIDIKDKITGCAQISEKLFPLGVICNIESQLCLYYFYKRNMKSEIDKEKLN